MLYIVMPRTNRQQGTVTQVQTTTPTVTQLAEPIVPQSVFARPGQRLNPDPNINCDALDTKIKCGAHPTICRWDVDSRKCLQIVNTMEELAENIQTNVLALSRQGSAEQIADLLSNADIIPRITAAELVEARSRLRSPSSRQTSPAIPAEFNNTELLAAVEHLIAAEGRSSDALIPPENWSEANSLYGDMDIQLDNLTGYDEYIVAIGGFMEQLPSIPGRLFSSIRSGLNNIWQTARTTGGNILSMLLEFFTNIMNNITNLIDYLPSAQAVLDGFLESMKNIIRVLNKIFVLIRRGSVSASRVLGPLINVCVRHISEALNYLIDISPAVFAQLQSVSGVIGQQLIILFRNALQGFHYLSYNIFNNVLVPISRSILLNTPHIIEGASNVASDVIRRLGELLERVRENPNYDPSSDLGDIRRRQRRNADIDIVAQQGRPAEGLNVGDPFRRVEGRRAAENMQGDDRRNLPRRAARRGRGGNMTRRKMSRRKMIRRKMSRRK